MESPASTETCAAASAARPIPPSKAAAMAIRATRIMDRGRVMRLLLSAHLRSGRLGRLEELDRIPVGIARGEGLAQPCPRELGAALELSSPLISCLRR